ncbi:hypothetical protein [Propionivibrio sp.]|uniref:hypothetical protein n=1 Tax=Propionivibrio sp. TaxID=2212460 RepID=UPI003BF28BEF
MITPYLGYSQVKSKAVTLKTPLPPPLIARLSLLTAGTHSDQHTVSIGTRWDFQKNLALKGQVDLVRGTPQ